MDMKGQRSTLDSSILYCHGGTNAPFRPVIRANYLHNSGAGASTFSARQDKQLIAESGPGYEVAKMTPQHRRFANIRPEIKR